MQATECLLLKESPYGQKWHFQNWFRKCSFSSSCPGAEHVKLVLKCYQGEKWRVGQGRDKMGNRAWPYTHYCIYMKWSEDIQSCSTLCNPMDCSLPGSSIHGILQARILEWVATAFSRRSSWPRDWTQVSGIVGRCFTIWATREVEVWLNYTQ